MDDWEQAEGPKPSNVTPIRDDGEDQMKQALLEFALVSMAPTLDVFVATLRTLEMTVIEEDREMISDLLSVTIELRAALDGLGDNP